MIQSGKLIVFSAPSGSGKTTIVKQILKKYHELEFSISATSRNIRINEIDGKDYYFFPTEVFKKKIRNSEFVEWQEVYENQFYGTLKSELYRIWNNNHIVVFDVDVIGGLNIKKMYPTQTLSIFVMPPSIDELKKRLLSRSTENQLSLQYRLQKAESEMKFAHKFDKIILNEDLDMAVNQADKLISDFLKIHLNI